MLPNEIFAGCDTAPAAILKAMHLAQAIANIEPNERHSLTIEIMDNLYQYLNAEHNLDGDCDGNCR